MASELYISRTKKAHSSHDSSHEHPALVGEEVTACISLSLIYYLFYYSTFSNLRSSCESVLLSVDSAVQLILCKRLGDDA